MNKYKNIIKIIGKTYLYLIIYLIGVTLMSLFNIINYKTISIISYITMTILFLISGIKNAKYNKKRGYIEGIKIGIITVITFIALSLIISKQINSKAITYYITLIISSTIGGMLGVNINK